MEPKSPGPPPTSDLASWHKAHEILRERRVLVLCGAGMSTRSGIPDYRGEGSRARARVPLQFKAFRDDPAARRRYWSRAMLGWRRFRDAEPNAAHRALGQLEARPNWGGLITQNVDGLHQRAGSKDLIELHGNLARVVCLDCGVHEERSQLQRGLEELNPELAQAVADLAPDGDADLDPALSDGMRILGCSACGGILKPDVVFFGESVPAQRVKDAYAQLEQADILLVAGSSLAVFSGYRFPRAAARAGKPVVLVNLGETRADDIAQHKVNADVTEFLPWLVRQG